MTRRSEEQATAPDSGVEPASATAEVNMELFEARLREKSGLNYRVHNLSRASSGHSNATWLASAAPCDLAIKFQSVPSSVHERAPNMEPAILTHLAAQGARVPRVLAIDEDTTRFGAPWFAMNRIPGNGIPDDADTGYMVDGWFANASSKRRSSIWRSFIEALASVHRAPLDGLDASRGGSTSGLLDYLRAACDDASADAFPRTHRLLDHFARVLPCDADDEPSVCMGDARLANALVEGERVSGLVDFEISFLGHPAADVGYAINHHRYLEHNSGVQLSGIPHADETWKLWEGLTHRRVSREDRKFWEAFGGLIILVTANRVIWQTIAPDLPDGVSPEDVNPLLAFTENALERS